MNLREHRQRGLSLIGFILFAIVLVLAAILAMKVVPVLVEYNTIKRQFRSMAEDPALRTARRPELDRAWAARATVDDIRSVSGDQIEYRHEGEKLIVSADYSVKVPLFSVVSACFDFHPTSE